MTITHEYRSNKEQAIKNYVKLILQPEEFRKDGHEFVILFEKIDTTDCITDDERQRLYNLIIEYHWGKGICMRITEWLDKLDMKRALLESPSFIDNL